MKKTTFNEIHKYKQRNKKTKADYLPPSSPSQNKKTTKKQKRQLLPLDRELNSPDPFLRERTGLAYD